MSTLNDFYSQLLTKRSDDLNQHVEDLKKLEAYSVCAKDTLTYIQKFISNQSNELKNLLSLDKITNETCDVSHQVLNNVINSLKSVEEESLKNYYIKLGAAEFIKKDMTDMVNSRARAQEAAQEAPASTPEQEE